MSQLSPSLFTLIFAWTYHPNPPIQLSNPPCKTIYDIILQYLWDLDQESRNLLERDKYYADWIYYLWKILCNNLNTRIPVHWFFKFGQVNTFIILNMELNISWDFFRLILTILFYINKMTKSVNFTGILVLLYIIYTSRVI